MLNKILLFILLLIFTHKILYKFKKVGVDVDSKKTFVKFILKNDSKTLIEILSKIITSDNKWKEF